MKLSLERLKVEYQGLVKEHNTEEFFTLRVMKLKQITSYHMFPIQKAQFGNFPIIFYEERGRIRTLSDIIEQKVQLLPTEIKNIVWQITKFMLHCEALGISHLRLCPDAIVLMKAYEPDKPIFVQVKDFSLGKEFEAVGQRKKLKFFQCLHPDLSISNHLPFFTSCHARWDIWSLGVILYYLIYKRSPFCKQGKNIFSKTVLRRYLVNDYEIHYLSNKHASINRLIAQCLQFGQNSGFRKWSEMRQWILNEEEIYNEIDFHDGNFDEIAEMHLRLMTLFTGIYCMIFDQCNNSPHPFWRKSISKQQNIPFQIKIAQFTLRLMKVHEDRFYKIYGGHIFLLRNQKIKESLQLVSHKLDVQLKHMKNRWVQDKFSRQNLTLEVIRVIQQVCANVRLQLSELDMQMSSYKIGKQPGRNSFNTRRVWKSMQTLHDYCSEVIFIFNMCKTRMKYIYEQFYVSKAFEAILMEDFGYKGILHMKTSEIIKNSQKRIPA